MSRYGIPLIFFFFFFIFAIAYRYYGRKLTQWFGASGARTTVAHERMDRVDYVPTKSAVLFGHHYSSIAGAGPIVGPVLAALWFGWLPTLLWVLVGAIFIGGVHDYASLMASLRHRGRSIGEICRAYLSPMTYRVFLIFVWFTLIYVLIVFLDLTAATFTAAQRVGEGGAAFEIGGAVATASMFYICIALIFGVVVSRFGLNFRAATVIFVPLVFLGLTIGAHYPVTAVALPGVFHNEPKNTWALILLIYCFAASITPVWVLLQPRDFLSSFLLFACLAVGSIGLLLSGFSGSVELNYPAYLGVWQNAETRSGFIFPLLFITVACGAVSGFHSLVASGTTSKQLSSEKAALPVAYGSMLIEGVLGLVALAAVMMLKTNPNLPPTAVFARGMGQFAAALGIPPHIGTLFGLLAISTFLLTTLDTGTRLTRFIFEEFFNLEDRRWRYLSTFCSLILPAWIVFMRIPHPTVSGKFIPAWKAIWPVFGTTNQLLAAVALLVVFVWFLTMGKKTLFLLLPMLFMLITATVSLFQIIAESFSAAAGGQTVVGVICLVLFFLVVLVLVDTGFHWRRLTAGRKNAGGGTHVAARE